MPQISVLFGSDAVRKFINNEVFEQDELEIYVKTYQFATQLELNAFVMGLDEANGWHDLMYFKEFEVPPLPIQ